MLHLDGFNKRPLTVDDTNKETDSAKKISVVNHHFKKQHEVAHYTKTVKNQRIKL
jgi:hypothetical protein